MPEITATYRVTTPMFCGDAHQEPELRLASFKGVLRFWWRALAWDTCLGADDHARLKELKRREDALFGSASGGQGAVVMRWVQSLPKPPTRARGQVLTKADGSVVGMGVRYLGYGLLVAFASRVQQTQDGELLRPVLEHLAQLRIVSA